MFFLRYLTFLGNAFPQFLICCVLMLLDFSQGYKVFSIWGWGYFINLIIKNLVRKPRPEAKNWYVPNVYGYSFPSGHSVMSLILYFSIAKYFVLSQALLIVLYLLPFILGYSRLLFKVHFTEDVIWGWIIGFVYLGYGAELAIELQQYLLELFLALIQNIF